MPTKTYTRSVITLFTKDEIASLLREAHNACKTKIKPTYHKIGKRGRPIIARSRDQYVNCIKEYINSKVAERVKSVAG